MQLLNETTTILVVGNVALLALLVIRPELVRPRGGKVLAGIAFLVLPILTSAVGFSSHMEHSKSTRFCLSCHVMVPYGQSLLVDDTERIPTVHFQNRFVRADEACFTCHTTYTMFGDYRAKLRGLRHVYVYYLGQVPERIKLYEPYNNRECLHCHDGSRRFEEQDLHVEARVDFVSGKVSCLDCHSTVHDVRHLAAAKMWKPWDEVRKSLTVWDRWEKVAP